MHIYVQKYTFHPFIDVYVRECNKGSAFDVILSEIFSADIHNTKELKEGKVGKNNNSSSIKEEDVLYLGDSENDDPAFRKVGVRSDERIISNLDCQYIINFDRLDRFLQQLNNNHLRFNEELLIS